MKIGRTRIYVFNRRFRCRSCPWIIRSLTLKFPQLFLITALIKRYYCGLLIRYILGACIKPLACTFNYRSQTINNLLYNSRAAVSNIGNVTSFEIGLIELNCNSCLDSIAYSNLKSFLDRLKKQQGSEAKPMDDTEIPAWKKQRINNFRNWKLAKTAPKLKNPFSITNEAGSYTKND